MCAVEVVEAPGHAGNNISEQHWMLVIGSQGV